MKATLANCGVCQICLNAGLPYDEYKQLQASRLPDDTQSAAAAAAADITTPLDSTQPLPLPGWLSSLDTAGLKIPTVMIDNI